MTDGVISLSRLDLEPPETALRFGETIDFTVLLRQSGREIGQVSLRMGESAPLYYFGHVGYHIHPPYRGHHYARRACELAAALFRAHGKRDVVITCDPDNWPSRMTCEHLGCELERIVAVPAEYQRWWGISAVKCRYIWHLNRPDGL